jgi:hypothetical protein
MNIKIEIVGVAAKDIADMKVIIIDKPDVMAAILTNSILAIVVIAIIDYSSNNNSQHVFQTYYKSYRDTLIPSSPYSLFKGY